MHKNGHDLILPLVIGENGIAGDEPLKVVVLTDKYGRLARHPQFFLDGLIRRVDNKILF